MALIDLITRRNKKAEKLRRELYGVLKPSKENSSDVAQVIFALNGGCKAGEYLYATLTGRAEEADVSESIIVDAEDFVICAHIMKLPKFSGRMDELLNLGPSWELIGNHWHQLSALASLEHFGETESESHPFEEDEQEADEATGITCAAIDALNLSIEPPVGGEHLARLIREQHPAHSNNGWEVREVSDRLYTQEQMDTPEFMRTTAVRLPSDCMGVVMCKFGVHPEFLVVKA